MGKRVREYTEMLLDREVRSGARERDGGLPRVLPIVVYNGGDPWAAAGRKSDLAPLPLEQRRESRQDAPKTADGGGLDPRRVGGQGGIVRQDQRNW